MGKRLRDVMDTHGLTQEAFAKKFGFTQGYFSQILMGKKNLSANFIFAISDGFKDLDLNWLIRGTGDMFLLSTPAYQHAEQVAAMHEPAMPYQQKAAGGVGVVEELQARVAALEKKLSELKKK